MPFAPPSPDTLVDEGTSFVPPSPAEQVPEGAGFVPPHPSTYVDEGPQLDTSKLPPSPPSRGYSFLGGQADDAGAAQDLLNIPIQAAALGGKAIDKAIEATGLPLAIKRATGKDISNPAISIPRIPESPNDSTLGHFGTAAFNLGAETLEGFSSPKNLALLAAIPEGEIGKAAAGVFGVQQFSELPEQIQSAIDTIKDPDATPTQKLTAIGRPGISAVLGSLMLKHGLAKEPIAPVEGPSATGASLQTPQSEKPSSGLNFESFKDAIHTASGGTKDVADFSNSLAGFIQRNSGIQIPTKDISAIALNNSIDSKDSINSAGSNPQFISDILKRASLIGQSDSGTSIPLSPSDAQGVVKRAMPAGVHDLQIGNVVIKGVPVNVVDMLLGGEGSSDKIFHDSAVKQVPFPISSDLPISANLPLSSHAEDLIKPENKEQGQNYATSTIRSDTGQLPQIGKASETGQEVRGNDVQQAPPVQSQPVGQGGKVGDLSSQDENVTKGVTNPEPIGMGGAVPSEFQNNPTTATGIKNAIVDQERVKRGLPAALEPIRRSFGEVWDKAMARIDQNPDIKGDLINELLNNPRALTDEEDALLLHRQVDLQNEYGKATRDLAQAHDDGRVDDVEREKQRVQVLSNQLQDVYEAGKKSGTETGRGLNARKMLALEDFSLSNMEMQMRADKGGRQLTDGERAQLNEAHKKIADLTAKQADIESGNVASQKAYETEISRLQGELGKRPEIPKPILEMARKITDTLHTRADAARIRLREKLNRVGSNPDPTIILDLAEIAAEYVGKGLEKAAFAADKFVEEFGDKVKPLIDDAWEKAKQLWESTHVAIAGDQAEKVKRVTKKEKPTPMQREAEIVENVKDTPNDPELLSKVARELAKNEIASGNTERESVAAAVHQTLKQAIPGIPIRDVKDAIGLYGRFRQLSKDPILVRLREIAGELQQTAKLEDLQNKVPLKKSGVERPEQTDEYRRLTKQVNEAKKKYGVVTTDPARQLKSALDSIKTRLVNAINDVQHEIATKTKIVLEKSPTPSTPEIEGLRKQLADLREQKDAIFGKAEMTDAQRVKLAMSAVEKSITDLETLIKNNDIGPRSRASKTPNTPELEAARAKREALREQLNELRDLDPNRIADKQAAALDSEKKALEKAIAEKERQLVEGDLTAKGQPQNRPGKPELELLLQRRDELSRQIQEARKKPESVKQAEALEASKRALEKSISEKQRQLREGDLKPEGQKQNRPANPLLEPLLQQRDELSAKIAEARKKPESVKEAERQQKQLDALNKTIAERVDKLAKGDLSSNAKPGKVNRPFPRDLELAAQRLAEVNKQIEEARKAARPRKTPDELALQRLKTTTKNREADYRDRLAKGDFEPTKRTPVTPDAELLRARADAERAKTEWQQARQKDQIKNRTKSEKFFDALIATSRAFILSSPTIFAKLAAAAGFRAGSIPVEAAVGAALRHAPGISKIAERAPSEGRMDVRAGVAAVKSTMQALKDAWKTLTTGESDLTHAYGDPLKYKNIPTTFHAIMSIPGRVHATIKAPIKRMVFEMSYVNRALFSEARGVDLSNPIEQLKISKEAYVDANRAIFQDHNEIAASINAFERKYKDKETGKETATSQAKRVTSGILIPIRTVPANIIAEAFNYLGGSVIGGVKAVRALSKGAENLTPNQADQIMRHLKKGAIGPAVFLLGWYAYDKAGGFYQGGKKKDESKPGAGDVKIGDVTIDHNLLHYPAISVFQAGATMRQVAETTVKGEQKGKFSGALAGIAGLVQEAPLARETADFGQLFDANRRDRFFADWVRSRVIPQMLQFEARREDVDAQGKPIKRKPHTIGQNLATGIPVLRQTVPTK